MIPGPLFSWPQLLLLLAPWLAAALGAGLLLYRLRWGWRHRHLPAAQRPRFWRAGVAALSVLATVGCLWGLVLAQHIWQIQQTLEQQHRYRHSRQHFVLPQDFQYGELRIPQGSLIDRYDPFDHGEPQRPLSLRGLRAVRFPHPVQVAGAWATAMETNPTRLELAHDQQIRPVAHFDRQAGDGYGAWVPDPARPHLDCKQGEYAWFHRPLIDYDIEAEFGQPEPDGPAARFRPSQWAVTHCESSWGPIELQPAAPADATPVWGALLPNATP